ncbi:MAG: FAA hydrolase family protein, partial [Gluconacetobacter diazotrophicus]|nr:FAA hydrolase family protein [Gluconacetobacter diazotrophicus]
MTITVDPGVAALPARLANLRIGNGLALGAETRHGVVDVSATAAAMGLDAPRDMDDLLRGRGVAAVRMVLDAADRDRSGITLVPPAELRFAPLVTRPEKIICVGFNYREHAK